MRYARKVAEAMTTREVSDVNTKRIRPLRNLTAALGAVVLALALSVLASWTHQGGQRAAAETALATDLAIAIDVNGDSMDDCDTIASTGTGSTCTVVGTATFGVKELVRSLAGMPDNNGNLMKEFAGMNWTLNYTAGGLVRVNSGMAQVLAGPTGNNCTAGSQPTTDSAGATSFSCAGTGLSTFTGAVLRIDFACGGTGSRTITMKAAPSLASLTWLHAETTHAQTVSKDSDEMLTINCVSAVGGIAELPGIDSTAAQAPSSGGGGGLSTGELAAIAGGSAAALAGAAWYVRRRRVRARA